jgi:GTP cyclohydrolase I
MDSSANYPTPITVSEKIRQRVIAAGKRYHAGDNISEFILEGEIPLLIAEVQANYRKTLQSLVIDVDQDPNSMETDRRWAKQMVNELMYGRFFNGPNVTAFPNIATAHNDKYEGMLVVRAEIRSMCSHHHQPVKGTAFIGILPSDKVIGLSKYSRIAQWCARRGTLQEDLVQNIIKEIQKATDCRDVGVHIMATHGCMENRGVMAHSSLTQTTALSGQFFNDSIKKEFFDNIAMQQRHTHT